MIGGFYGAEGVDWVTASIQKLLAQRCSSHDTSEFVTVLQREWCLADPLQLPRDWHSPFQWCPRAFQRSPSAPRIPLRTLSENPKNLSDLSLQIPAYQSCPRALQESPRAPQLFQCVASSQRSFAELSQRSRIGYLLPVSGTLGCPKPCCGDIQACLPNN